MTTYELQHVPLHGYTLWRVTPGKCRVPYASFTHYPEAVSACRALAKDDANTVYGTNGHRIYPV